MNIEGVNLSSSSVNTPVQAGQTPLSDNGASPESFSNTLTGQVDLLNKATVETNSSEQVKSITSSKPNTAEKNMAGMLQSKSGEDSSFKELFNNQSVTCKKNTPAVADKNTDFQSTLQALTDALRSTTENVVSDTKTVLQNIDTKFTDKPKPAAENIMPDAMTLAQYISAVMVTNGQETPNSQSDKSAASLLKSITLDIMPDVITLAQNMSAAKATNAHATINPQSDKALTPVDTQNIGTSKATSDLSLVTSNAITQPTQNGLASNSPSFENQLVSEKTQIFKDQLTVLDAGQLAAELTGTQQVVITNRMDSLELTKPITHPDWSKDLGNQIIWMNNKEISTAEIKMNPEHLGPISVRIDLSQDQASVQFTAQHAAVKEALEASIPKLSEMLGTQQLNLTNVTISQSANADQGQSQSPYQSFSRTPENQEQGMDGIATDLNEEATSPRVIVNKGLLSVYA